MEKYAVIVAGGIGKRMGSSTPKQFLCIDNKPILMFTLEAFLAAGDIRIVLVLPEDQMAEWKQLAKPYNMDQSIVLVGGGEQRTDSVLFGLNEVPSGSLVAVHDGVRPFVSLDLIARTYESAARYGSGIASIALKDSIREIEGGNSKTRNRDKYRLIQTPQVFRTDLLKEAYEKMTNETFTDDASVFEAAGHAVTLVDGDYRNIKITTPEDLEVAKSFAKKE